MRILNYVYSAYNRIQRWWQDRPTVTYNPSSYTENETHSANDCYLYTPPIKYYQMEGKGLCVIFANFVGNKHDTCHLPGYTADIEALKDLFGNYLNFDVLTKVDEQDLQNLSSTQFRMAIRHLQIYLQKHDYIRLFVFVLSHGNDQGLCMCKEGTDGEQTEGDSEHEIVICTEEIINSFTHDKVPSLSGCPKCFFFQACRGNGYVKAAVTDDSQSYYYADPDLSDDPGVQIVVTRADVFAAYSTLDQKKCFVNNGTGSWFIQRTVEQIKNSADDEHLVDIMANVTNELAIKSEKRFFHCNSLSHEIRVLHGTRFLQLRVFGKVMDESYKDSSSDDESENGDGYRELYVSPKSLEYTGFTTHTSVECGNTYNLVGTIEFKKEDYKNVKIIKTQILTEKHLRAFRDGTFFSIRGSLKSKTSNDVKAKGKVIEKDKTFMIKGEIKKFPKDISVIGIDKYGLLNDEDENNRVIVPMDTLLKAEAQLYVDGQVHGTGEIGVNKHGVYGMHTDVYQLPIMATTLRKKLYLKEPKMFMTEEQQYLRAQKIVMAYWEKQNAKQASCQRNQLPTPRQKHPSGPKLPHPRSKVDHIDVENLTTEAAASKEDNE